MFSRVYRTIAFLIVISLFMGMAGSAQAATVLTAASPVLQETDPLPCSNLDVIFIIDQSSSMRENDPTEQRKNAVIGMIDLLVDLALDQCPGSYHRIGVISFGDEGKARIDLDLSDINPRDATDAQNIREELKAKVLADNLGQTYPEQAFEDAWEMFEFSAPAGGDEPRKKVILFVTDGFPCVPDGPCDPDRYQETANSLRRLVNERFDFTNELKQREECLAKLRAVHHNEDIPPEETTGCLEANPVNADDYKKSTYIFTILLRNSSERVHTLAQEVLDQMSYDYAGQLIPLNRNREEIPTTLRVILSQLAGVRPNLLNCGGFAVNPYLKKAILTAYKNSAGVQITLSYKDADGVEHMIQGGGPADGFNVNSDTGYQVYEANERYAFDNPYPGIWQLASTDCEGIDVYYEAIDVKLQESTPFAQRPQYDRSPFYNANNPFYLEFALRDSVNNGAVVLQADKAIFAIDVKATVTDPSQKQISYTLKWNPEAQTFRAEQPLQVPLAGVYKLNIIGTSLRHEGEPAVQIASEAQVFDKSYTLFNVDGEFTGLDVTPIELASVSPLDDEKIGNVHNTIFKGWPLKVVKFPVRVKLIDETGGTVSDPRSVLVDPDTSITAQLTFIPTPEPGREEIPVVPQTSDIVTLKSDPDEPGEFFGEIPNFEHEGQHTLTLKIGTDKVNPGYWPYSEEVKVEFTRTDCLFCRAGTYYAILTSIIILILALIIYNIAIRTNKISGSLIFVDGSTTIAEFGLYSGTNIRKFKKRELDGYPQLMLKSMKAKNIGKKRRTTNQDGDVSGGSYFDDQQGIHIDCVSSDGRKFPVELHPKTPTSYSNEETFAQMIYEPIE